MEASYYTYRVLWSEEDQEFVGLCAEFPSLSWLDEDQHAAFDGIVQLVSECLGDTESLEEPPEQHRQLAIERLSKASA